MDQNYLQSVRDQYENYPYPFRKAEEEKTRLMRPFMETLEIVNHYCFEGKRQFGKGFRFLAAGGGTGDAAVFMAEQLRDTEGEVVYLDMSESSMKVAKDRAKMRGLTNIKWVHASLLDLPKLGLGEFDFINCCGVLHHLSDPEEGLAALNSVLKADGALSIMVYGQYGRTGVYQMQAAMKLIGAHEENMQKRVDITKWLLQNLPNNHIIKAQDQRFMNESKESDVGVYDLYLHSQDRAYTVPELYEFINSQKLNLVGFAEFPGAKRLYDPKTFYKAQPELLEKIQKLPLETQHAIAEITCGHIIKHGVYLKRSEVTFPSIEDKDMVPTLLNGGGLAHVSEAMAQNVGQEINLDMPYGAVRLVATKAGAAILAHLDGLKSVGDILSAAQAASKISELELKDELCHIYNQMNAIDCMVLRHHTVPAYKTYADMQNPITVRYQQKKPQDLKQILRKNYG